MERKTESIMGKCNTNYCINVLLACSNRSHLGCVALKGKYDKVESTTSSCSTSARVVFADSVAQSCLAGS